jgi:LPXTG-motif cell wall-anchored protein
VLKSVAGIILSIGLVLATSGAASATTPDLPTTTSWTDAGLQEMVRFAGPISVSVDGAGFESSGTLQVSKPANATVIAAYLTSSVVFSTTAVPVVTLNGTTVNFSHKATDNSLFINHFADVTSIVKPVVDAAVSGLVNFAVTEVELIPIEIGSSFSAIVDGESLIVVFDDPAKPDSTAIVMFGTSRTTGDSFTFSFPPISNLSRQIPTLHLGIGYSFQELDNPPGPFGIQQSDIKISTSSNTSLQTISLTAGGQDDGANSGTALMTVGGIGDSRALPGLSATDNDDELYGLESFLAAGDTSLTVNTLNVSGDDNLFLSVLYFEGVAVDGAIRVGSAPTVFVETTSTPTPAAATAPASKLATTGANLEWLFVAGLLAVFAGSGFLAFSRRKRFW